MVDFGYDISDFYDIHYEYGVMADFEELVLKAHALGKYFPYFRANPLVLLFSQFSFSVRISSNPFEREPFFHEVLIY